MRELLKETAERAIAYLEGLESRSIAPTGDAVARLRVFDEPLPDDPTTPESVLQLLDEFASPATMATAGPRFFGFVIGGSLPVARRHRLQHRVMGSWWCADPATGPLGWRRLPRRRCRQGRSHSAGEIGRTSGSSPHDYCLRRRATHAVSRQGRDFRGRPGRGQRPRKRQDQD